MKHLLPLSLLFALSASAVHAGPVSDLLPGLADAQVASQEVAQVSLATLCAQAGRPGAGAERAAVAKEIAGLLTTDLSSTAALPLLRQAGLIGGDESVAAVAALLKHADAAVRDAARQALELIPATGADAALRAGLAATKDPREIAGFLSSLGRRPASRAATTVAGYLASDSDLVRHAALTALATLADADAVKALAKARQSAPQDRRAPYTTALFDAALAATHRGQASAAIDIYKALGQSAESEDVRAQALLGLLLADPAGAAAGVEKGLKSASEADRVAAITAVERLKSPALARTLAAQLANLSDPVKVQALAALAAAGEPSTGAAVTALLASTNEAVARGAIRALSVLGDAAAADALLQLGADAKWKKDIASALEEVRGPGVDERLLSALMSGTAEARALALEALLARQASGLQQQLIKLAGESDDKLALPALAALKRVAGPADFDPLLAIARTAATRARAEAALAVLFAVGGQSADPQARISAIGTQLAGSSADTKRALLSSGAKYGQSAPLPAAIATLRALAPLLDDKELGATASHFTMELASRLLAADPELVADITARVQALPAAPEEIKAKARSLTGLEDGWLLSGLIAGPYEGADIFTKSFPPEADAAGVAWAVLSPEDRATGKEKVIDLAKKIPGDNRVGYLKFAFQWPAEGKARLEFGSDDGLVVWLNGQQVHAKDATRPCRPGDDKVDVTLKQGMNRLLVKVVQRGGQFEFVGRVVAPASP